MAPNNDAHTSAIQDADRSVVPTRQEHPPLSVAFC